MLPTPGGAALRDRERALDIIDRKHFAYHPGTRHEAEYEPSRGTSALAFGLPMPVARS